MVYIVQHLNLKVFSDSSCLNFFILLIWLRFLIFVRCQVFPPLFLKEYQFFKKVNIVQILTQSERKTLFLLNKQLNFPLNCSPSFISLKKNIDYCCWYICLLLDVGSGVNNTCIIKKKWKIFIFCFFVKKGVSYAGRKCNVLLRHVKTRFFHVFSCSFSLWKKLYFTVLKLIFVISAMIFLNFD